MAEPKNQYTHFSIAVFSLMETAGTFHRMQQCMQYNFLKTYNIQGASGGTFCAITLKFLLLKFIWKRFIIYHLVSQQPF